MILDNYLKFFFGEEGSFKSVGSIKPSSENLARKLVDYSDLGSSRGIIQCGTGTGVVTQEIISNKPECTQFLGVEIDSRLVRKTLDNVCLAERDYVLQGDASDLLEIADSLDLEYVDRVISTLPMTLFSPNQQEKIMGSAYNCLADDGIFTAFYYPFTRAIPGRSRTLRNFEELVEDRFEGVVYSDVVWRNVPPARVISGRYKR